jgi:hypothetical protein
MQLGSWTYRPTRGAELIGRRPIAARLPPGNNHMRSVPSPERAARRASRRPLPVTGRLALPATRRPKLKRRPLAQAGLATARGQPGVRPRATWRDTGDAFRSASCAGIRCSPLPAWHACSWSPAVTPFLIARSGRCEQQSCATGSDGPAAGQQRPGIVEQDDAVAEQAPALLGMAGRHTRGHAIRCQCVWAPGMVLAHIALQHCELSLRRRGLSLPDGRDGRCVGCACHRASRARHQRSIRQAPESQLGLAPPPEVTPAPRNDGLPRPETSCAFRCRHPSRLPYR